MALPQGLLEKMKRARVLFDQARDRLIRYYQTQPGEIVQSPDKTEYLFRETSPIPVEISLTMGDCLQNVRSTLDYLVGELAISNGGSITTKHMFPICSKPKSFKDALDRKRLEFLPGDAVSLIKEMQPFNAPNPESHSLAVLEELVNLNKHRRIVLTALSGSDAIPDVAIPYMPIIVRKWRDGRPVQDLPFWAYLVIGDTYASGIEITHCVNVLADYVGNDVIPRFERFFS